MIVSVIIPTYGEPVFLAESIRSVQSQSFTDWEMIIVDDNNPDTVARQQTEELVGRFAKTDSRIRYIKHECNMNGAVARNTGFAVAQGKYISLLDSDDLYLPNRLQKCFDIMEKAPADVAGVYTGCEFRRGGKTFNTFTDVKSGNFLLETLACTFMFCTGSNIFVRKSVVDQLKGFDPTFLRHQDYEFLVRLFEKYSLEAIPEVLVVKNNENVNLPSAEKMIEIKEQYLKKFEPTISSLSSDQQRYIYHTQYALIGEAALRTKKYSLSRRYYRMAGRLTMRETVRRLAFTLLNIIR